MVFAALTVFYACLISLISVVPVAILNRNCLIMCGLEIFISYPAALIILSIANWYLFKNRLSAKECGVALLLAVPLSLVLMFFGGWLGKEWPLIAMLFDSFIIACTFLCILVLTGASRRALYMPGAVLYLLVLLLFSAYRMDSFFYWHHGVQEGDAVKTFLALHHPLRQHSPEHLYFDEGTEHHDTPLTSAARGCHVGGMRVLLSSRADIDRPNAVTLGGGANTPLHMAAAMGCYDGAAYLVQKGAAQKLLNANGNLPIQEALSGYKEWHDRHDAIRHGKDRYKDIVALPWESGNFEKEKNSETVQELLRYVRENRLEGLYSILGTKEAVRKARWDEKMKCSPIPGAGGVLCSNGISPGGTDRSVR